MCKAPNKSKITTFLRQCLTSTSAKADLSALYSPSDLSVEQEVKELQAEGLNIAQISKKLDIARQTVRKYMGCDTLPKRPLAIRNMSSSIALRPRS